MTQTVLQTEDLTLGYGDRAVIDNLTLTFPDRCMTSILGPNGCGKSTLLRALARLLRPAHGTVTLDGDDVFSLDTRALARRLAILPQAPNAPDGITVMELIKRGRTPWRGLLAAWSAQDLEKCTAALRHVGLEEQMDRPLNTLSGGQRQRAWIALVLAQDTPYLLLDEPTTWLDLRHQLEVLSLLRDRNKHDGTTVITVLHDLNLAARYSDHLILLGPDGLVAAGSPDTVLSEDNLHRAFGLDALVTPDPVTGTPMVVPR